MLGIVVPSSAFHRGLDQYEYSRMTPDEVIKKFAKMEAKIRYLRARNKDLKAKNEELEVETNHLKTENDRLKTENADRSKIKNLMDRRHIEKVIETIEWV